MTNEERDKLFEFVNFMTKYILEVQKEQDEKYASNDRNRMYRRGYIHKFNIIYK
jgi:coproporphyrinogen III oxidase